MVSSSVVVTVCSSIVVTVSPLASGAVVLVVRINVSELSYNNSTILPSAYVVVLVYPMIHSNVIRMVD